VKKIDAIFELERAITGLSVERRRDARHKQIKPLVEHLHLWMKDQRSRISSKTSLGKALHYSWCARMHSRAFWTMAGFV
jgi:transposase